MINIEVFSEEKAWSKKIKQKEHFFKEICNLFNTTTYPTNVVIDKNGYFYDYISGGFPKIGHQISNSIRKALEEK